MELRMEEIAETSARRSLAFATGLHAWLWASQAVLHCLQVWKRKFCWEFPFLLQF